MSTLLWLNALLSLNQASKVSVGAGLNYGSADALINTLPVEWLCAPKYGGNTKVLFLAAGVTGVKHLKITEKKKETPLVSVSYVLLMLYII